MLISGIYLYVGDTANTPFGMNSNLMEVLVSEDGKAVHNAGLLMQDDNIIVSGIEKTVKAMLS